MYKHIWIWPDVQNRRRKARRCSRVSLGRTSTRTVICTGTLERLRCFHLFLRTSFIALGPVDPSTLPNLTIFTCSYRSSLTTPGDLFLEKKEDLVVGLVPAERVETQESWEVAARAR